MAVEHEFSAMEARTATTRRAMRDRFLRQSNVVQAYRRLFLNDDGDLKPEAARVLADMARVAGLGTVLPATASDAALREREGKRGLALHVIARIDLDGNKLRELSRQIRELEQ